MKASVTTKIQNHNNQNYVAQFSTSNTFETVISTNEEQPDNFSLINFSINGLLENTRYYVRIVDSLLNPIDSYVGSFKTPANSPSSFKFGFASCSWSDSTSASNQRIYDNIANKALSNELDFFFHLGDMHYRDISINDESLFQDAFDDVFAAPRQNNCWKNLSMFYMWDDHDYGQNDTDKNSPSRDAATEAFRRRVPSPPLANNLTNGAVYYSFVRGRVRFIVTDLRSEREPKGAFPSNDPLQKPFSDTQRDWFFAEMLAAKDSEQIIVWINTKPWISSIENEKDDWGGYHAARLAIVNFIETNGLRDSIVVLSGDMHALAYDDGSSSNNFGDLKVCHAAPLDQESRAKGGPYTIGPIAQDSGTGWSTQYGIIEVTDNGDDFINIRFKGIVISKTNFTESTAIDIDFNLNVIGGIPDAPNIPIASNITNNSFIVSWDAVNNADSYVLQYTNGSNIQTINAANNAGQAITELTAGTTYYVRVRAVNSAGESANSPNLVQITRPDEPSIPTLIAVADAAFVLQWNAVTGAESYTLEVSTIIGLGFNSGIIQTIYDANNTSQAITGLTAGTIYYVRVRAVNSAGQSANSSILTQRTITLAPNAPTLTNVSTSGFTASWNTVAGATSYILEYSTSENFSSLQTIPSANNAGEAVTELNSGTTYYVRVRAVNSAGNSAPSPFVPQITVPGVPTGLLTTSVSATGFTANWTAVMGAQSYRLDVSTFSNFATRLTGYDDLTVSGTSRSITGLTAGSTYYVQVRAVNSAGTSQSSEFAQQQTPTVITVPNAPNMSSSTSVTATGFTANWTAVTNAQSYRIDVSLFSNFATRLTDYDNLTVNGTSQPIIGLTAGTTYYVQVRAVNSAGTSADSDFATQITLPGVPNMSSSTSVTATGFTANWTAVSSATSYILQVSTATGLGFNSQIIQTISNVNSTSQAITGLNAGTTYYVRVRAVNGTGQGGNSNPVTQRTLPDAPTGLSITSVTATGFTANWNAVTSAQRYRLDVSLFSNFATRLTDYDNLTVNGTSQPITGLTAGTTYYVQVRAENGAQGFGQGAYSNPVTQITLPGVPNMSSSTSVTATGFTANWNAVPSATSYTLQVSTATGLGFNSQIIQTISNVNSTSQAITGLNAGTTYYVRVRAVNGTGQGGNSNPVTQRTLPDAPTGLSITSVTATGFTANWNAVTSAQRYRLDVSLFSNFATRLTDYDNLTVNGTSQPITGLTAGTTYYVQVRAENGAQGFGQGAYSNPVTQITLPNAPTGLSITSVTTTGFTANWNAVSNATSYLIDVSAVSGFGSFIFGYQNKTVNALTLPITGLAPGTTYYVRVYTVTSTGTSDPSFPVEKITITPAPNLPTLTNVSTGGFTASWNAVAGANSYTLEYSTSETFSSLQTIPFANNTGEAVTELNSGTTYYVRVRAVNDGGISAPSPFAQQQTLTFTNPFYYDGLAIYLGNENAVTDDDININIQEPGPTTSPLTYVTAGRYVDNIGGCNGANNCALGSVTLNFPCDLVRELTLPVSERPYSVSILSLSDFKNTVDNFESIIKDPNVENYILESFADKDNVLVRTLSEDICPVSFCAACTGIVLLPQTAGDIENLEATQEWNSWFLNSRIKNDTIGSFDCSSSGAMNLDLQYSSQLLPNYLSGILSTGISIQYRSALPHGCGNWGAYKVYAIKYLNEAVYYKENNFLNFDKVLLATGIYAGGSNENELLANFTVPNVFRMVESQVTFRVDMTTAIQIGEDFFYNGTDEVCVAGSFNDFDYFQYKLDRVGESNIFETTITINGSNLQKFEYSFGVIYEGDFGLMTLPEFESVEYRNFIFREGTQILNTFCWKNNRTDCPTENLIVSASINSTNQTLSRYTINEIPNNPPITLVRGNTYEFIFQNLSSQTFWIKTSPIVGTTNAYPGTTPIPDAGIYNFTPNRDTPNTLYYISENNSAMQGIINIVNPS
jgi:hypothetical protein